MIKRLLGVVPVVFGVAFLTFLLVHAVPGDPVEVMLGESASSADRMQLEADLGLNQPIYLQFGVYLNKLAHGDLGVSIYSKKPIVDLLAERLPATAQYAYSGKPSVKQPPWLRRSCRVVPAASVGYPVTYLW